jgi:hypothetical protein
MPIFHKYQTTTETVLVFLKNLGVNHYRNEKNAIFLTDVNFHCIDNEVIGSLFYFIFRSLNSWVITEKNHRKVVLQLQLVRLFEKSKKCAKAPKNRIRGPRKGGLALCCKTQKYFL